MTDPSNVFKVGILTSSERVSDGTYPDRGGDAVEAFINDHVTGETTFVRAVSRDRIDDLQNVMKKFMAKDNCHLIITTGGTGPSPSDVTPEATAPLCQKLLPGFSERMRAISVDKVPTAILSRAVAGISGSTLLINLPGSPKAVNECLGAVLPAIPDCLELIGACSINIKGGAYKPH